MKFFQRPVFRVVGIIIVATVVGVLGLTSTVSDQAENEGDILSTSALSENGPLPSEEILKLNSLEKTFLDSDFYRKDGMLPLTVTKDQKYFVTYKLNKQSMAAENELILIGMPRQLIELYLVDLSENKAAFLGKTEFVINQAWSEDGARLALVSHKSVKVLDHAKRSLAEVPMKYETDIYNASWGLDNRTIYLHLDKFSDPGLQQAKQKSDIRDLMLRVLYLYGSESPKLEDLKQVFINTYDPIPQEALENIVLETEGLEYWQFIRQEIGKNVTMTLKMKAPNRAAVILDGKYFRGPHELVEINGKWYVTGLSTWPDSQARKDVYRSCTKFIDTQLKTGEAEAYFRQKGIQDDYDVRTAALLHKIGTRSIKIEVGEIELWSMSVPHRAVNPDAKEARVKMIVTLNDGSAEKLQGYFSRADSGDAWIFQGLGKLSPGLFPQTY